jgi:hypothetical protein
LNFGSGPTYNRWTSLVATVSARHLLVDHLGK